MRRFLTLTLTIVLIAGSAFYSTLPIQAEQTRLQITEIMPDPTGDDNLYEWLELQNFSNAGIDLNTWKINGSKLPQTTIQPNEIVILAKSPSSISSRYSGLTNRILTFSSTLANSAGTLQLTDNTEALNQTFQYGQSQEDKSFELLSGGCNTIQINSSGNTIGKTNTSCFQTPSVTPTTSISITPISTNGAENYSNLIYISKVSPCTTDEQIELTNSDTYNININDWHIEDKSGNKLYLTANTINANQTITIAVSKVTLNDSGDTIALIDPSGMQKDLFIYPACSEKEQSFSVSALAADSSDSDALSIRESTTQAKVQTQQKEPLAYPKLYL